MHSDLLAGPRLDGRVRPIEVPSFVRKISVGALMEVLAAESESAAGPCQYGLKTSDGAVLAFSVIEHAMSLDPSLVVASVDVKGAHSNIRRDGLERVCDQDAPRLAQLLRIWYHAASPKTWRGARAMSRTSSTGVGQGFPEAGPLFCAGLGRLIRVLRGRAPEVRVVAFQDDTYLLGPEDQVLLALPLVRSIWAELGLEVNESKLKLYSKDEGLKERLPEDMRKKLVDNLGILGQRLALRLEEAGVDFIFEPHARGLSISLEAAKAQLLRLSKRLREIVAAGLPMPVADKMWMLASKGAITHLQAADLCSESLMAEFQQMQRDHLEWTTGRSPSERDLAIACLPWKEGGRGLPDHARSAVSTFLSAQCRVLPGVCKALEVASVEDLVDRCPDLGQKLAAAKNRAIERGATLQQIPWPTSAAGNARSRAKGSACAKAMCRSSREDVEGQLSGPQRGRLRGQGRRGASLWMDEPLPRGEAPANSTWKTMIRQRVLMPAPGADRPPLTAEQCGHCNQRGSPCETVADDDGVHECLCNAGGGPLLRHNRVREWLADKLRHAYGGKTLTEQPHPLANSRGIGRMDLKHDSAQGHLDIDVTITSIHTSNVREALRRQTAPERSIRSGVADKLTTYGPGVLAFAADDTGAIGTGALRLLRRMALHAGGDQLSSRLLKAWRAELQHIILQSTAGMAQGARRVPRTA